MTVVGILWVVLTPYATGVMIASSRLVNRVVSRHLTASTTVGWSALGTLFTGVFAVGGRSGFVMALASAPFVGLAFWTARPGPDNGDGPPAPPEDIPPAPDAIARKGVRLPAPRRTRPTGHRPAPARSRTRY